MHGVIGSHMPREILLDIPLLASHCSVSSLSARDDTTLRRKVGFHRGGFHELATESKFLDTLFFCVDTFYGAHAEFAFFRE